MPEDMLELKFFWFLDQGIGFVTGESSCEHGNAQDKYNALQRIVWRISTILVLVCMYMRYMASKQSDVSKSVSTS